MNKEQEKELEDKLFLIFFGIPLNTKSVNGKIIMEEKFINKLELLHASMEIYDRTVRSNKTFINKLLKKERERIKEIVVCADRIYTDEHNRSVANEYKTQILKQL